MDAGRTSTDPGGGGLRRVLGPFDATMMVMGCIIGAGIFRTPMHVAEGMGSAGGILGLWLLGGVLAMCGAFVFAELAGMLPQAGGQYVFLREAYGRFVAFLFGWLLLAAINSGAIAFIATVFADHLDALLAGLDPGLALSGTARRAVAIAVVVGLTVVNALGVRLGATLQNAAMVAKLAGLLVVVALGAAVAAGLADAAEVESTAAPPAFSWHGLGAGVLAVVFSYGGWQNVAAVASEVRDPARTLPRAILLGTTGVILLYVALNAALLAVLGPAGLAATATPAAEAAGRVVAGGEELVAGLVVLSTFAIAQVLLLVTPRIYYAMARDGVFLRAAGYVSPRRGTPVVAIALQGGMAIVHLSTGSALDLLQMTVIFDWVFFALSGVALFVLRRRRPDAARPYRALGYPWLPGVFVLVAVTIVVQSLFTAQAVAVLRSGGVLAVGLVLYAHWTRRARAAG